MSLSLIVFKGSGQILYQQNSKVSPFNDLIYSIVNETYTELSTNLYMFNSQASKKRLYGYKHKDLWAAVYFDLISTIDSDKIKQALTDVLTTYTRLEDEPEKRSTLIDFQFNKLLTLDNKPEESIRSASPAVSSRALSEAPKKKKTALKKMRKWVNGEEVDVEGDDSALDYSGAAGAGTPQRRDDLVIDDKAFTKKDDVFLLSELKDVLDDVESDEEEAAGPVRSGFFAKVSSYFGASTDINALSKKFTDQLIAKNIAPATAAQITARIKAKLSSLSVTMQLFQQALVEELTKILTPNVSTDLLYDIKKRSGPRPYVISVVGVNGVGKSTNLAKLAFWLLQNNMNVLICACDTFRSGAVEQLKVHVNNLKRLNNGAANIDLFEKGYGGGDHVVNTAKLAIAYGQENNFDVILIDTAGRTHLNAKLMAPLRKFGDAADPDKIIMVGEALVGTDSVEQAVNFNNAFGNKRGLNFFIILKVDTVGDLVGAMINMVMATKVPILFVGTGQTYTDIKKLSVKRVVDMLMT